MPPTNSNRTTDTGSDRVGPVNGPQTPQPGQVTPAPAATGRDTNVSTTNPAPAVNAPAPATPGPVPENPVNSPAGPFTPLVNADGSPTAAAALAADTVNTGTITGGPAASVGEITADMIRQIQAELALAVNSITRQSAAEAAAFTTEFAPILADYARRAASGDPNAPRDLTHIRTQAILRAAVLGVKLQQSSEQAFLRVLDRVINSAVAIVTGAVGGLAGSVAGLAGGAAARPNG